MKRYVLLIGLLLVSMAYATVTVTTTKTGELDADGSTVEFAFSFPYWATSEISVDVWTDAGDVATRQTETTHYTVSPTRSTSGGTVTFETAPDDGNYVVISRTTSVTQDADIDAGAYISKTAIEDAFDEVYRILNEHDDAITRSMRAPQGEVGSDWVFGGALARAETYPYFGVTGAPTTTTGATTSTATVSAFGETLLDDADAAAARVTMGVQNIPGNTVNVQAAAYGAVGNGSTNDLDAIQTALDTGYHVYVPHTASGYKVVGTLTISTHGQKLFGDGWDTTTPYSMFIGDGSNDPLIQVSAWYVSLENIAVHTATTGIRYGTEGASGIKAGNPLMASVTTKNCSTAGVHCVYGNSGRVYNFTDSGSGIGWWMEDATTTSVPSNDDCTVWFMYGMRASGSTTGFKIETNHQTFHGSTETCTTGLHFTSTALSNYAHFRSDNCTTGYNNEGSRNNHVVYVSTNAISGTMSGWQYGTAPIHHMKDEMVIYSQTEADSGATETASPLGFRSFITVENQGDENLTLNLDSLDAKDNEGEPFYLFFPAANDSRTEIVLSDPDTYNFLSTNQSDDTKYRVWATGDDQLIEIMYVGDSEFSIRELGGELPYENATVAVTEDTAVNIDTNYKHNQILTLTNTDVATTNIFDLEDWDDVRVGYSLYIFKPATTSDITFKISDATYSDGSNTDLTLAAATIYLYKLTKINSTIIGRTDMAE